MKSMQPKYGGAEMVLAKIQKLEEEVYSSAGRHLQEIDAVGLPEDDILQDSREYLENLFPFPSSICSHMGLIRANGEFTRDQIPQDFVPMDDEWASWLFSENYSFVDLFDIYGRPPVPTE
ncbi:hypothetical protein Plec18167_002517 [Paecilomyces lecythidis]|uniref:Uncharacterized protein n=1 Tax=Paecilomyces lecythidis TaxID=3004212 RepID=A0ABR3Y6T0_9EURO